MQMRKFKQFGLVLCCIFSLFASSFAMCFCSHHGENAEPEAAISHHHHAEEDEHSTFQQNDETDAGEEAGRVTVSEQECRCIQRATLKTVVKSETVKLKKHLAEPSPSISAKLSFVPPDSSVEIIFSKPLYLSDSFYNLSPGRAPPRL